jgi:methionine transaminase
MTTRSTLPTHIFKFLNIKSRLPEVGTSIFSVMSKMALEYHAINLSQGFPDFPVSEKLIDSIHQQMKAGHNQYAPMPGVPALRKTIAEMVNKTYQRPTDFETEVTITAGGTEAIFSTIASLITAGDEVIVFDPAYDCYAPAVRLNGGIPIHINLLPPAFPIDWEEVKNKITSRTRMIIINTPHNPTGAVLTETDLMVLQEIALTNNLIVLSDEVYEHIIFDGIAHQSILKFSKLRERSIAVFSFGKTFHATGWKVGYVIAPENITREIRKAHQFVTFSVNTPIQFALAEYMADPNNYLYLGNFYQQKRDFFLDQIKGSSFEALPCHGSYFQLLSYKAISGKKEMPTYLPSARLREAGRTDREMAEWMTKEKKLAPIPVSAFLQRWQRPAVAALLFC